jgi:hypothetical protein
MPETKITVAPPKITIATPAYGEIFYAPYVQSMYRLVRACERQKWNTTFATISYADIVESRNFLLTNWFDKTDATHLLFIDADMGFEPQLVIDMIGLDKPVVGVVYPKRQIDLERLTKLAAEGEAPRRAINRSHDFILRRNARSGAVNAKGFIEVDGIGAGVMLIRRDCVDTMLKKMPELSDKGAKKSSPLAKNLDRLIRAFEPMFVDAGRLSEDFAFCHRWRQCGGEIWANVTHEITHIGLHRFKGRYSNARTGPRVSVQAAPVVITGKLPGLTKAAPGQAADGKATLASTNGKATPAAVAAVVRPAQQAEGPGKPKRK